MHACQPDVFSAVVTPRRFHPLGQKHTLLLSAILAQTGQTDRQQRSYFCLHQRALPRQTVHELSSCWLVEKFQLMDCAKPNKARPITCCELDSPRALMISPRHWVFFESEPLTVGHHRPLFCFYEGKRQVVVYRLVDVHAGFAVCVTSGVPAL